MIASAVAAMISAAAVATVVQRLVAVGRLGPAEPRRFEEAARSGDASRINAALDALFPSGWSPALGEALLRSDPGEVREAAVAELNEQLGDVDRDLRHGENVPRSAARIALFSGVFGGIVELSRAVGSEHADYSPALSALGFGIVGALVSAELGRRFKDRVGDVRAEWDRVATVFSRKLGEGEAKESAPGGRLRPSQRRKPS